jgi:hypothetical protein
MIFQVIAGEGDHYMSQDNKWIDQKQNLYSAKRFFDIDDIVVFGNEFNYLHLKTVQFCSKDIKV